MKVASPRRRIREPRRGVLLVEAAIVYSVTLMLLVGTITMALGIFRYQQVAWLAREGARWAAVHGSTYQSEQNDDATTSSDIMTNVITPKMIGMTSSAVTCSLSMTNGQAAVTVSYTWTPEAYWSPLTFTSKSVLPITY